MNADLVLMDTALMATVVAALTAHGLGVRSQSVRQASQALQPFLNDLGGDVVVVQSSQASELADLQSLEAMTFVHPQSDVILITSNSDQSLLFSAMRAGVREVLTLPLTEATVRDALQRCKAHLARVKAHAVGNVPKGKVAAFVSCKGGSGASFSATHLASLMAAEFSRNCALLDLDVAYGDASFYLGAAAAKNNISDLTQQIERLDAQLLLSCMHPVAPRLSLLAAPQDMETALSITAHQLEKVLVLTRQQFEVVVLDVHRTMDALAIQALDFADVVYLVMGNTMPSVRDAKRLVKLLRSLGYPDDKLRLLVNGFDPQGFVDVKSIEDAVGLSVVNTLPQQVEAVAESISLGQSLVKLQPKNPWVDALRRVAAGFLQTPAPRPKTWLSRWVGAHA